MLDMNHGDHGGYERPALVRLGAVVDVAEKLADLGVDGQFQVTWTRRSRGVWENDETGQVYDFTGPLS